MIDRLIGVQCAHRILHDRFKARGVSGSAHQQHGMEPEPGQINLRLRLALYPQVMRVGNHPNHRDLVRMRSQYAEKNVGAQRIPRCQIAFGKSRIHDEGFTAVLDILLLKDSATLKRESECMKESGTDVADLRRGKRSRCRGWRAFYQ